MLRTLSILLVLSTLTGCAMSPKPARTEVKPGESYIKSERDERRPTESVMKIRAKTAPAPAPQPSVRLRVILPNSESKQ